VNFAYEHKKEAIQVLDRGGQADARGICLSMYLAVLPWPLPAKLFLLHPPDVCRWGGEHQEEDAPA